MERPNIYQLKIIGQYRNLQKWLAFQNWME